MVTPRSGAQLTDRLFTGQQKQPNSELYHYGARMYSAEVGRMLAMDARMPGSW